MRTWIFQGNPDDYDIDAYLAFRPAEIVWLVTRYAQDIAVGDRVYFWRNQGARNAEPGIIAECIVITAPVLRGEDPDGLRFWRVEGPRATTPQVRAALRLIKVASSREVLRRDWCAEDPVLRDLPNLRMQAGTNYPVTDEQAARLASLWSRTGRDWSRSESIAGLVAYADTYSQAISRLPGSPVARIALLTGRAVSGAYAKVMNFRSLDPRATGQGMSGASDTDRAVWREFYDPASSTLRITELQAEFTRVWGDARSAESVPAPEASAAAAIIADEADRLEELMLEQLLARYAARRSLRAVRPMTRVLASHAYDRDPLVIAIARMRAAHRCEVPGCHHPSFETAEGLRYTEVHHIVPLADGGEDIMENVACLCPAHHREVHLGAQAAEITAELRRVRNEESSST